MTFYANILFPASIQQRRDLVALLRRIRTDRHIGLTDGTADYRLARELEDAGRITLTCYGRRKGVALYRAVLVERGSR